MDVVVVVAVAAAAGDSVENAARTTLRAQRGGPPNGGVHCGLNPTRYASATLRDTPTTTPSWA